MANKTKKGFTTDEIVTFLKDEVRYGTIEGELLKKQLIRELYKRLGTPTEEDFPDEYKIAGRGWKKQSGFTKWMGVMCEDTMKAQNNEPTNWHIKRPSPTKLRIVDEYTRAGWSCTVQAYNVMCYKYVKHPRYKNIWVCFYSSRDCNKYEYVIELGENE